MAIERMSINDNILLQLRKRRLQREKEILDPNEIAQHFKISAVFGQPRNVKRPRKLLVRSRERGKINQEKNETRPF